MSETDSLKLLQLEMLANAVINSPSEINQSTSEDSEKHSSSNLEITTDDCSPEKKVLQTDPTDLNLQAQQDADVRYPRSPLPLENVSINSQIEPSVNSPSESMYIEIDNIKAEQSSDLGFSDDENVGNEKIGQVDNEITNTISQIVEKISDEQTELNKNLFENCLRIKQEFDELQHQDLYNFASNITLADIKLNSKCFVKLVDCKAVLTLGGSNLTSSLHNTKKRKNKDKTCSDAKEKIKQPKLSTEIKSLTDDKDVSHSLDAVKSTNKLNNIIPPSFITSISSITNSCHLLSSKKIKRFMSEEKKSTSTNGAYDSQPLNSLDLPSRSSSPIPLSASTTSNPSTSNPSVSMLHSNSESRANIFSILTPVKCTDIGDGGNCNDTSTSSSPITPSTTVSNSSPSSAQMTLQMLLKKYNSDKYQPRVKLIRLSEHNVDAKLNKCQERDNNINNNNSSRSISKEDGSHFSSPSSSSSSSSSNQHLLKSTSKPNEVTSTSKKLDITNEEKTKLTSSTKDILSKSAEDDGEKSKKKEKKKELDRKSKYSSILSSTSTAKAGPKKTKEDEVLKKLQDTIRIKPIKQQSSNQVKRIPKINQALTEEDKARSVLARIDKVEPLQFNNKYPTLRQHYNSGRSPWTPGYPGHQGHANNEDRRHRFGSYRGDGANSGAHWRNNYNNFNNRNDNKLNNHLNNLSAMNKRYNNRSHNYQSSVNMDNNNKTSLHDDSSSFDVGDGSHDDDDDIGYDNINSLNNNSNINNFKNSNNHLGGNASNTVIGGGGGGGDDDDDEDFDRSLKRRVLSAFKEVLKKEDDTLSSSTRHQVIDICLHIQKQINESSNSSDLKHKAHHGVHQNNNNNNINNNNNNNNNSEHDNNQMMNMLNILKPLVSDNYYQSLHKDLVTNKKFIGGKDKALLPLPPSPHHSLAKDKLISSQPSTFLLGPPRSSTTPLLPDPHVKQQGRHFKTALLPNPHIGSRNNFHQQDIDEDVRDNEIFPITTINSIDTFNKNKFVINDEKEALADDVEKSVEQLNNDEKLKEEEASFLAKLEEELKIMEMLVTIQKELVAEDEQITLSDDTTDNNNKPNSTTIQENTFTDEKTNVDPSQNTQLNCEDVNKMANCVVDTNDSSCDNNKMLSPSSSTPSSIRTNDRINEDINNVLNTDKQQLDAKALEDKIIVFSRNALKSHYHKGAVTSQEFKVIMRKAISKISESKSKDITQSRVTKFIDAYVEKLTAQRKKTKC